MYEYMNFKCRKCGNWLDCSKEEFEVRDSRCEECSAEE